MTSDYGPSLETEHYAMQAPNDINRHLDDVQLFNWGYSLPANEAVAANEVVLREINLVIAGAAR